MKHCFGHLRASSILRLRMQEEEKQCFGGRANAKLIRSLLGGSSRESLEAFYRKDW